MIYPEIERKTKREMGDFDRFRLIVSCERMLFYGKYNKLLQ